MRNLLKKLLQPSSDHLNILTTNYDRYIEYCCDHIQRKIDIGYNGMYLKKTSSEEIKSRKIINVLKVHGSLDSFSDLKTKESVSIPLQEMNS